MRWGAAAEATQSSSGERDRVREVGARDMRLGRRPRGEVGGAWAQSPPLAHPRAPTLTLIPNAHPNQLG